MTSGCGGFAQINASSHDILTRGTQDQIVIHNETGAKICGWRPNGTR